MVVTTRRTLFLTGTIFVLLYQLPTCLSHSTSTWSESEIVSDQKCHQVYIDSNLFVASPEKCEPVIPIRPRHDMANATLPTIGPILWLADRIRKALFMCHYPVLTVFQWKSKAVVYTVMLVPLVIAVGGMGAIPLATRLCFGCSASLITLFMYIGGTMLAFLSLFLVDHVEASNYVSIHAMASSLCAGPLFIIMGIWSGFDSMKKGSSLKCSVTSIFQDGPCAFVNNILRTFFLASLFSTIHALLLYFYRN